MPTYVYECERCGHRFEVLQGISDPPKRRCPKCRGKVKRVITSGGGLIFKGSGFYITDYKRKETGGPPSRKGRSGSDSVPPSEKPADGKGGQDKKAGGDAE